MGSAEVPESPDPTAWAPTRLQEILNRLLDGVLTITAVLCLPAIGLGVWRAGDVGWRPVMTLHLLDGLLIWSLWGLRRKVPYLMKVCLLLAVLYLAAVGGLATFAQASAGGMLLVVATVLATLFLGLRWGIVSVVISTLITAAVGLLVTRKTLLITVDMTAYVHQPRAWATAAAGVALFAGICVACVGLMRRTLLSLVARLAARQQVLLRQAREIQGVVDQLHRSETKYRTLFESAHDGIFVMEGVTFVECNERTLALFGCQSKEQLLGKTPFDFSPPTQPDGTDSETSARERLARVARGEAQFFEWRHRRLDGSLFDVEVSLNLIELPETRLVQAIVRDVTERKRAQVDRERLIAILESTSDMVSMATPSGQITYINPAGCRLLGWSVDPLDHHVEIQRAHPDWAYRRIAEEGIPTAIREGIWRGETALLDAQGREIPVSQVILAHTDRSGQLQYLSTIIRDMRERKRAEQENLRLKNYLNNVIDSMPSMLIGADPAGRITQWNAEAERKTHLPAEQALGRRFDEVLPQWADQLPRIVAAIRERSVQSHQRAVAHFGSELMVADITVFPLVTNGIEGAVVRIDDVTDHVRLEEMMIQAEKMATVGGLAAGMAHEINNPLGVIVQGTQTIRRRLSAQLPANVEAARRAGVDLTVLQRYLEDRQVYRLLDLSREAGMRAAEIVRSMLQFSRQSGTRRQRVALPTLVEHALDMARKDYDLRKRYDFLNVAVDCQFDPGVPEILCIPTEIEQVLLNLLKNATQALLSPTPRPNPAITIRTGIAEEMAFIEVQDNGPGMDEAVRRRVFEPFFTTKEVGVGTGLGLAVSFMIVTRNHRGRILVDSEPGRGARFRVCLPMDPGPLPGDPAAAR